MCAGARFKSGAELEEELTEASLEMEPLPPRLEAHLARAEELDVVLLQVRSCSSF